MANQNSSGKGRNKLVQYAIDIVVIFLLIGVGVWLHQDVVGAAIITSGSMQPTLMIGDKLMVDHRQSLHGHYKRGDILVFNQPPTWSGNDTLLSKRLIGLPGEKVEVRMGQVFINGQPLTEPYVKNPSTDSSLAVTLGPDQYYMAGDNRANSDDSRSEGPVADQYVWGRVIYRVAPMGRFGKITGAKY